MSKIFFILVSVILTLGAVEIPTQKAKVRTFAKSVKLNSQVIQLSNAKESIMSIVGGHIERYFVKAGESVKKGQKIVLLKSMKISKMSAEYISLKKQFNSQVDNFKSTQTLYKKGMTSKVVLNEQTIKKDELFAKLTALESQLHSLGIKTKTLKDSTSNFILYAHSDGIVSAIISDLDNLDSNGADTLTITLTSTKVGSFCSIIPSNPTIIILQIIICYLFKIIIFRFISRNLLYNTEAL
jgi:hypothetical protein